MKKDEPSPSNSFSLKSILKPLKNIFRSEPKNRQELIEIFRAAEEKDILDSDSLEMVEGVFEISQMQVRDIMLPRSQMIVLEIDDTVNEFLPKITGSSHSRFPVIGENRDEVIGIVMAKDLLKLNLKDLSHEAFPLKQILRTANFVPESKRLAVLLSEFRKTHNHMAIVIDEYGGVAGLVTIEDILEEIVGDIEDEFDTNDGPFIQALEGEKFIVNGLTPIEDFNEYFHVSLSEEEFDTIGGLVTHALGHVPLAGEKILLASFQFHILSADKRRVRQLEVEKLPASEE